MLPFRLFRLLSVMLIVWMKYSQSYSNQNCYHPLLLLWICDNTHVQSFSDNDHFEIGTLKLYMTRKMPTFISCLDSLFLLEVNVYIFKSNVTTQSWLLSEKAGSKQPQLLGVVTQSSCLESLRGESGLMTLGNLSSPQCGTGNQWGVGFTPG